MRRSSIRFVLLVSLLSFAVLSYAQGAKKMQSTARELPTNCESALSLLDFAVIDAQKLPDTYLIIVARLGKNEPAALNQTRLNGVAEYIQRRGYTNYVLGVGKRTSNLGRLELYVGGKLHQVMPFEKNAKGYCIHGLDGEH